MPCQDDLDHSGVIQKAVLPAVDDVMAAVLNTTNSWKKERVKPIPETIAEQKGKPKAKANGQGVVVECRSGSVREMKGGAREIFFWKTGQSCLDLLMQTQHQ